MTVTLHGTVAVVNGRIDDLRRLPPSDADPSVVVHQPAPASAAIATVTAPVTGLRVAPARSRPSDGVGA